MMIYVDEDAVEGEDIYYRSSMTTELTSIVPRHGTVEGGTLVTFYAYPLSPYADIWVTIDGVDCAVQSKDWEYVTCITGAKTDPYAAKSLEIYVQNKGLVSVYGQFFHYVQLWSDPQTWGYDTIPLEGEAVHIPSGLSLLYDIDTGPKLGLITVEGSLFFVPDSDPAHERTLNCEYILVRNGYLEIGTEAEPYTSKLVITMYGTIDDPTIATYGNAVLAIRDGTLEMHGENRYMYWSQLAVTANAGDTQITLVDMGEDVGSTLDWQVGETIVIASTDTESENAEFRNITAISDASGSPVITLDSALEFTHFGEIEYVGSDGDFIDMRAEVGLLSRNLVFRGDPDHAEEY